jgi:hypothetical protein
MNRISAPPAAHPNATLTPGLLREGSVDNVSEAQQLAQWAQGLIGELAEVQADIRRLDPLSDSADELEARSPTVLEVLHQEYADLRELRLRQALLRRSIDWTTHGTWPDSRAG